MRLGLDRGHLSKLLRGQRPFPSAETRRKLLQGLDVPFEALFAKESDSRTSERSRGRSIHSNRIFRLERRQVCITVPWIVPAGGAARGEEWMETLIQDLKYSLRGFARRPGFVLLSALILALGIGAVTGVFSFVNALFLRPLDLNEPSQLVRVFRSSFDTMSYPNYKDLRGSVQTLSGLAAHQYAMVSFGTSQGSAESLQAELVSGNYFSVLKAEAHLGRTLSPQDDVAPGAHPVAVVSHRLWQRRLAAAADAVGSSIFVNGRRFTVIGVMPPEFSGSYESYPAELWAPLMMYEQVRPRGLDIERRGWGWLHATGRLKAGTERSQATAEVEQLALRLQSDHPGTNRDFTLHVEPAGRFPESYGSNVSSVMAFFSAVAGLVLLVACGNVASMLLARTASRRREIAVRMSLGAGRGRLLRQWLTESLLLSLLGAAGGIVAAFWTRSSLLNLRPPGFENLTPDARLDLPVLGFAMLMAVLTALVFGTLPARRAAAEEVSPVLHEESPSSTGGRKRWTLLRSFVAGQVAASAMLLISAGLMLRSLQESSAFDPGFDSDHLLLAEIDLRTNGYPQSEAQRFFQELSLRLQNRPEVRSVAYATSVPLGFGRDNTGLVIPGHEPPPGRTTFSIPFNQVSQGYFETMGIARVQGRTFDQRGAAAGLPPSGSEAALPVVINRTMAQRFWPGTDPEGERLRHGPRGAWLEIAGVVEDITYFSLGEAPRPFIYVPYSNQALSRTLHVRTAGDPQDFKAALRREVEALDPGVVPRNLLAMSELRALPLYPQQAMASVSAVFGALALMLTAVGLYGLLSYAVSQRTFEIGVRMALGADPRRVWLRVVLQGLRLTAVGLAIGSLAGWGAAHLLSSFLFGIKSLDPLTYLAVGGLLLLICAAACAVPARSASAVDPLRALRAE